MNWMSCIHGVCGYCSLCAGYGTGGGVSGTGGGYQQCKHGNSGYGCSRCLQELNERIQRAKPVLEAEKKAAPVLAEPVKVEMGWQCPVCKVVWAPSVQACKCATGATP